MSALAAALALCVLADGPADNDVRQVRRQPKEGIEVPAEARRELEDGLARLRAAIDGAAKSARLPRQDLLLDVEIHHKAVNDALRYREVFEAKELDRARELLAEGLERAAALERGTAPWDDAPGLVVRGYRSRIDGSVQPYGLVVPASYSRRTGPPGYRLDIWLHGRGETLSELNFLDGRRKSVGDFAPADTIVLHPYGRYCNANKLAGEIDVLEALEDVQRRYPVDEDRIGMRGFSMGGAGCWQLAVHYADRWFAAAPGAGFAETPEFLRVFQKESVSPPPWEQKLWRLYDCPGWALNLAQCPVVAYSGEKDAQKQAADIMAAALARLGIDLEHVIGPGMGHSYDPQSKARIEETMRTLAARGRERLPRRVSFVTYTLRYDRMSWLRVTGMKEHWEPAKVVAAIAGPSLVTVEAEDVTALELDMPAGWCPFDLAAPVKVKVGAAELEGPKPRSDRSWRCGLLLEGGAWRLGKLPDDPAPLRKRHGLQGPVDDAFLDSFVFVKPGGACRHPNVDAWVHAEMDRAIEHWRRHFRGEARVVADAQLSAADIATANLVLWGDPGANQVLARIADRLPLRWDGEALVAGAARHEASHHAPILIYPNPLNPSRYVVLNSGFTFREYDYLNNARQTPKLPDWAIVDLDTPPGPRWAGKIAAAGFFDERWRLRP